MPEFSHYITEPKYRHVLGLSGGKDSAALAVYIKDRYPDIHERVEYFFSDTGAELQEVYDFLDKLKRLVILKVFKMMFWGILGVGGSKRYIGASILTKFDKFPQTSKMLKSFPKPFKPRRTGEIILNYH